VTRSFPRVAAAIFALLCALTPVAFAAPDFPPLTGRVVDQADILSQDTVDHLTAISRALEQKTHDQLVVTTLKSLDGNDIAAYGYQLGRHWGIGQKGKNTGVLLIVAPTERKVRIEVGYGLEGALTDAQSILIIDNIMKPAFRRGDYDGGVLAGAAAISQVLGVENADVTNALSQEAAPHANDDFGAFPMVVAVFVILLVFSGVLLPLLSMGGRGRWGGGGWGGGFGGGGFSGGGGFHGGGFSGGGGSFGGGGASGSW
jgi:uncharacterized protein